MTLCLAGFPVVFVVITSVVLSICASVSLVNLATGEFQVRKNVLHVGQVMSDVSVVDDADAVEKASNWAEKLLARVHRGPGDSVDAAMHRAEQAYGIPAQTFWALRYRKPKAMAVAAWLRIKEAYDTACASQEARLRHELEISKHLPPTPARLALVREVEALLGPGDRKDSPTTPTRLAG